MHDALLVALLVAGHSVSLTLLVRAVPPFRGLNERGVKPVACDLCMSFWTTLTAGIGLALLRLLLSLPLPLEGFLGILPAFAIAYAALQRVVAVPEGDPGFPDPPQDDENPGTK